MEVWSVVMFLHDPDIGEGCDVKSIGVYDSKGLAIKAVVSVMKEEVDELKRCNPSDTYDWNYILDDIVTNLMKTNEWEGSKFYWYTFKMFSHVINI